MAVLPAQISRQKWSYTDAAIQTAVAVGASEKTLTFSAVNMVLARIHVKENKTRSLWYRARMQQKNSRANEDAATRISVRRRQPRDSQNNKIAIACGKGFMDGVRDRIRTGDGRD